VDQDSSQCSSDLGLEAAKRALVAAGTYKSEIDLLILATLSPDADFPGTACFLQAKLDVPGIPALDVRQQCTGFLYGLSIAEKFIRTGAARRVLLVGAETHSKGLDKSTRGRDVSVLFGDGAGAVVLGPSPEGDGETGIISTHLHADGRFARELWLEYPSMNKPGDRLTAEMLSNGDVRHYPSMNGKTVFTHAVKRMPEVMGEALDGAGLKVEDVDLFVFHQANLRINEMVAKQMGIPAEKVFNTIDRFGNTTASTIPIGLDEAVRAGRLKPGMLVGSAAFGSGFTWGSALIRW
jgi:3-oxoacyl-[acyl-carrier-protein] synthase-3